jgi:hypothetical protein
MKIIKSIECELIKPFWLSTDAYVLAWFQLCVALFKTKEIVVVTGAGISVTAGIPVCYS